MCLGIPGEVVEISRDRTDLAEVDVRGTRRTVNLGLLEGETIAPGDWVLIHVGFALSRIDREEAEAALAFLESLGPTDPGQPNLGQPDLGQAEQMHSSERRAVPAAGEQ